VMIVLSGKVANMWTHALHCMAENLEERSCGFILLEGIPG